MRSLITIALIIVISPSIGLSQKRTVKENNYIQFPKKYQYRDSLVKYIVPDKNYTYWEYARGFGNAKIRERVVLYSSGTKPGGVTFKNPEAGFFPSAPVYSDRYIAYIYDGQVGYITSESDFLKFIGSIDNLEEATLLAELKEKVYPDASKKGGAYLKTGKGYELILTTGKLCPETKEAIQITIKQDSVVKRISKGVYFKTDDCAII
jgi:hypothetical protein